MAANKFGSIVHRNTNRFTLVLVYTLLEWILIALILINSLFSYLILKYTQYFGLKRPCVLCSSIEHGCDKRLRKDMICDDHATVISELNFFPTSPARTSSGKIEKSSTILPLPFFDSACENDPNMDSVLEAESRGFDGDSEPIDFSVSVKIEIEKLKETRDKESSESDTDSENPEIEEKHCIDEINNQVQELASTVEKLERVLEEAYAELEQERSDAAEASAQTMLMITRLQEEKAALQLEASQYQRMMEEQMEFDQEAVLLLDEIARRRERENQELEKELEFYRKRFDEKMTKRSEERNSESVSVCYSSFGDHDSDGVSTEDDDHHHYDHRNQLALDFESERLSVLDQLNKLEQKLFQLNGADSEPNELLPLFDNSVVEHHVIEEEMGKLYGRLEALEEDKEFLNKCIESVKDGDEGMGLVQEILQHLRALRRLER